MIPFSSGLYRRARVIFPASRFVPSVWRETHNEGWFKNLFPRSVKEKAGQWTGNWTEIRRF